MHALVIGIAKYAVVLPVAIVVYVCIRLNRRQRIELAVLLGSSIIVATLMAKIAGALHQDPRPFVRDGVRPYFPHGIDNGFPSDHTMYSTVIALVVFRYRRLLGMALAVTALAIGTARVIAGVHHGQDIVAGFLIAAIGVGLSFLGVQAIYLLRRDRKQ